jgi:hypothetical protein
MADFDIEDFAFCLLFLTQHKRCDLRPKIQAENLRD